MANRDDLISISAAVYRWMKDKVDPLCDTWLGISRQELSLVGDITSIARRMSTQAWDAICGAVTDSGFNPSVTDTSSLGSWKTFAGEEDFLEWIKA